MASIKINDPKYAKPIVYSMDDRLKWNLDTKVVEALKNKDKDYVICIDGMEGCLFEDTLVKTSNGDVPIKDLCNGKSFFVESLNLETKENETGKAVCVKSGTKELFEIETEDGRTVRATQNHTFFIMRDGKILEVKLSDLKEGDDLICQ